MARESAQLTRSTPVAAQAEQVWEAIGGYHAIADWHPAVASSTPETHDGVEHRRLALEGGGEILEMRLGGGRLSYGYAIASGPLPVADYVAIFAVAPAREGSVVVWSAAFKPTSDEAEDVIAGIFEAGLAEIAARFT